MVAQLAVHLCRVRKRCEVPPVQLGGGWHYDQAKPWKLKGSGELKLFLFSSVSSKVWQT